MANGACDVREIHVSGWFRVSQLIRGGSYQRYHWCCRFKESESFVHMQNQESTMEWLN